MQNSIFFALAFQFLFIETYNIDQHVPSHFSTAKHGSVPLSGQNHQKTGEKMRISTFFTLAFRFVFMYR